MRGTWQKWRPTGFRSPEFWYIYSLATVIEGYITCPSSAPPCSSLQRLRCRRPVAPRRSRASAYINGRTATASSITATRSRPEYANLDRNVLNDQGVSVGFEQGEVTAEERAELERRAAVVEAERRSRLEVARRDRMLLETYLTVADIEDLRDRRLELLESQIKVTELYLSQLAQATTGAADRGQQVQAVCDRRGCAADSRGSSARHLAHNGIDHALRADTGADALRSRSAASPRSPATSSASASSRAASDQPRPVWPNPPLPRSLAAKFSTTSNSTWTTGTTTSCAMRSPGSMRNGCAPRFQHEIMSSP